MQEILSYYLLALNLAALALMGIDKWKAKRRAWRISEKRLFLCALLGGGPGAWAGMYLFHHKTKHWYFAVGIPLITLVEYGLLAWAVWFRTQ